MMASLPAGIDPRIAYLVMLNGMEETSLHGSLADVLSRNLCAESDTLAAAQKALRFLTSGDWLVVKKRQAGYAQALSGSDLEFVLSSPDFWALPVSDEAPVIVLEPTELGIAEWASGFPILGLSEQTRSSLMFSEAGGRVRLSGIVEPLEPHDGLPAMNRAPLVDYFREPFPKASGFSAYRFPGLLVHLPVILIFLVTGAALTLYEPYLWPLLALYLVAGLYFGRDLAILAHYSMLITLALLGGFVWLIASPDMVRFLLSGSGNPVLSVAITLLVATGFSAWVRWQIRR